MIRPLKSGDLDAMYRLRREALISYPASFGTTPEEESKQWMAERLKEKDDEDFILGFFTDEHLIGMIGCKREEKQKKRHKAWIWGMYVEPSSQGQGIGRALMDHCIERAQKIHGLEAIVLSVTDVSEDARNLYEQVGFEEWGVEPNALKIDDQYLDEVYLKYDFY